MLIWGKSEKSFLLSFQNVDNYLLLMEILGIISTNSTYNTMSTSQVDKTTPGNLRKHIETRGNLMSVTSNKWK